jgi:hypothetical protein
MPAARGQQFVVQEPTLETFGVGTAVSVPDRGRTSLGGVRRSAAGRSMYGPIRTGHSLGFSDQGTGLSVQARVHDLEEMDRAVLEAAGRARKDRDDYQLSPAAQHAYDILRARRNVPDSTPVRAGPVGAKVPEESTGKKLERDRPAAEKMLVRARQAESAGKRELALTYLRAARDQGAPAAQAEIVRLTRVSRGLAVSR